MSFRWTKFLDLAQELMGANPPVPEARLRSAISRAYYAAFHEAKDYLDTREGVPHNLPNIHEYIINRFTRIKHNNTRLCDQISDDLDQLRRDRNRADYYQNSLADTRKKAANALTVAKRIIYNVAQL